MTTAQLLVSNVEAMTPKRRRGGRSRVRWDRLFCLVAGVTAMTYLAARVLL